jgi:hypothetical protein
MQSNITSLSDLNTKINYNALNKQNDITSQQTINVKTIQLIQGIK